MPDAAGKGSRLSFPATWGGEKRAAMEFDRPMTVGLSRIQAGGGIGRRKNPFFLENDDRAGVWIRGDRDVVRGARRVAARRAKDVIRESLSGLRPDARQLGELVYQACERTREGGRQITSPEASGRR